MKHFEMDPHTHTHTHTHLRHGRIVFVIQLWHFTMILYWTHSHGLYEIRGKHIDVSVFVGTYPIAIVNVNKYLVYISNVGSWWWWWCCWCRTLYHSNWDTFGSSWHVVIVVVFGRASSCIWSVFPVSYTNCIGGLTQTYKHIQTHTDTLMSNHALIY